MKKAIPLRLAPNQTAFGGRYRASGIEFVFFNFGADGGN